jgi:hypothetical protein
MEKFLVRAIGICRFDEFYYRQVRDDPRTLLQAIILLVLLVVFNTTMDQYSWSTGQDFLLEAVTNVASEVFGLYILYLFGRYLYFSPAAAISFRSFFQILGFSAVPGFLTLFVVVPYVGWIPAIIGVAWAFATTLYALYIAFDYNSLWHALGLIFLCGISLSIPFALFYWIFSWP